METTTPSIGLLQDLAALPDPRQAHKIEHLLIDIVTIGMLAVICGVNDFVGMAEFGRDQETWLRGFLKLPHGIPTHDTFGRVLARLKPRAFEQCFQSWAGRVAELTEGEVVPLDGKTLRRSHDRSHGCRAIELVSAWSTRNRLTLGQVKVAADSNEITAVPQLLRLLVLKGCIVTVDAIHTQKETVREIRRQEAAYVCALKGNHPLLEQAVAEYAAAVRAGRTAHMVYDTHQTVDGEHGRIETRKYWSMTAPEWLPGFNDWQDLCSLGLVESTRQVGDQPPSVSLRYYLSSLAPDAPRLASATRGHWSIENECHWILDVAFREDECRVRTGYAAENFGLLRRWSLSLLQQEQTAKVGVYNKRLKAARSKAYLLKVVNAQSQSSQQL